MLSDPLPKFYWDSCAWLGFINKEANKHESLKAIWERAERGECEIWTSDFVYIEVHKAKAQGHDPLRPEESDKRIDAALEQPFVVRIALDSEVGQFARQLRRQFPTELRKKGDAIHLASAVHWNADVLYTYDGSHLLPLNGKISRRDGKPLPITLPPDPMAGTLFEVARGS